MQEVLETAGDEEEEDRDSQNAVLGREKGGLQVDERTSREGQCSVSGPEGSVHYPGMEQPALTQTPGTRLD